MKNLLFILGSLKNDPELIDIYSENLIYISHFIKLDYDCKAIFMFFKKNCAELNGSQLRASKIHLRWKRETLRGIGGYVHFTKTYIDCSGTGLRQIIVNKHARPSCPAQESYQYLF